MSNQNADLSDNNRTIEKSHNESKEEYQNSKKIMASYGGRQFFGQWHTGPFGLYVFFFYETEIGLSPIYVAAAFIIYSIWNAFNDPIMGYVMEKYRMPWEKRWGKRFPWFLIGAIPFTFTYLMIFYVPSGWDPVADQWAVFGWLVVSMLLFDTCYTFWDVSSGALYPEKFPGSNERRTAASIGTVIGMIGIVASSIVPPLFVIYNDPSTYKTQAWVIVGVAIVVLLLVIPGIYENRQFRERYQAEGSAKKYETPEPFLTSTKFALTNRRLILKVFYFFTYQAAVAFLAASANYVVRYILKLEAFFISIVMGAMLIGALISAPLWLYYSQKINNNKKMSLIAGIVMFGGFIPMLFVNTLVGFVITLLAYGVGLAGQWFMDPPTMGDVLDDIAIKTGRRDQAIYYGYQTFFARFGGTAQAIVFAVVHLATGFVQNSDTQSAAALWGIRVHTALIPAIFVLVGILLFWKFYDLTPDKVAENERKLEELGL